MGREHWKGNLVLAGDWDIFIVTHVYSTLEFEAFWFEPLDADKTCECDKRVLSLGIDSTGNLLIVHSSP